MCNADSLIPESVLTVRPLVATSSSLCVGCFDVLSDRFRSHIGNAAPTTLSPVSMCWLFSCRLLGLFLRPLALVAGCGKGNPFVRICGTGGSDTPLCGLPRMRRMGNIASRQRFWIDTGSSTRLISHCLVLVILHPGCFPYPRLIPPSGDARVLVRASRLALGPCC